jgi:hypothetical protein
VKATLIQQEYFHQSKKLRSVIRAYLQKVTGWSLSQITRSVRHYRQAGETKSRAGRRHRCARKYTLADIALLAEVARAHKHLSARRRDTSWCAAEGLFSPAGRCKLQPPGDLLRFEH